MFFIAPNTFINQFLIEKNVYPHSLQGLLPPDMIFHGVFLFQTHCWFATTINIWLGC